MHTLHNDEPALLDILKRGPLIEEVGKAIADCTPPQVFGIHGDWGLGKTSFLHQVQWYLTGDCPQQPETAMQEAKEAIQQTDTPKQKQDHKNPVRAVWFDAWRYQNEAAPVVALLHEMRAQLSWQNRIVDSTSRHMKVLTRGALLSLEELTKKIGFQYSKFGQANREWESENLAATLPSHTLREHLQEAIRQLLPEGNDDVSPRLAVFIDDVDRCEPEAAYRLLEGLKIYLNLGNCVFVLGMNQKAIEEAIEKRMRAEGGNDPTMRAAAYMEKLCQNVWRLPAVRQPEKMLHDLLERTVECPRIRDWIIDGVKAPDHPCLPPNPRRLKGLANLLGRMSSRRRRLHQASSDEEGIFESQLLIIVAYIYHFHHDLYVRWEAHPVLYNKIWEWCIDVRKSDNAMESSEDQLLSFLQPLELPLRNTSGTAAPTPADFETTFPDPTQANVFWIQSLILHLEQEATPKLFKHYLHGVQA